MDFLTGDMLLMLYTGTPPGPAYRKRLASRTLAILSSTWREVVIYAQLELGFTLQEILELHDELDSYPVLRVEDDEHGYIEERLDGVRSVAPKLREGDARVATAALFMPPRGCWLVTDRPEDFKPLRVQLGLRVLSVA